MMHRSGRKMVVSLLRTPWEMGKFPVFARKYLNDVLTSVSTGYGQHGDYVFGWKEGALQKAMDQRCFGNTCAGLTTQSANVSTKCGVPQTVKEPVDGWLLDLPGGMAVTYQ
jgi:hypothetical protein